MAIYWKHLNFVRLTLSENFVFSANSFWRLGSHTFPKFQLLTPEWLDKFLHIHWEITM